MANASAVRLMHWCAINPRLSPMILIHLSALFIPIQCQRHHCSELHVDGPGWTLSHFINKSCRRFALATRNAEEKQILFKIRNTPLYGMSNIGCCLSPCRTVGWRLAKTVLLGSKPLAGFDQKTILSRWVFPVHTLSVIHGGSRDLAGGEKFRKMDSRESWQLISWSAGSRLGCNIDRINKPGSRHVSEKIG
jgi:hypothetical protein